jgi:hypothetical protein
MTPELHIGIDQSSFVVPALGSRFFFFALLIMESCFRKSGVIYLTGAQNRVSTRFMTINGGKYRQPARPKPQGVKRNAT